TVIKEWEDRMERGATTASSLEAKQECGNINKTQSMATLNGSSPQGTGSATARTNDDREVEITARINGQVKTIIEASLRRHLKLEDSDVADEATFTSVDVDAGGATTTDIGLDAGQGSERVESLENDLKQTKLTYGASYTKLIKKVKKLEKKVQSNQARRRARIVVLEDEDTKDDSSKKGRKIDKIDQDPDITLVQHEHDMEYDFDVSTCERFTTASVPVTTAEPDISTANVLVSTAGAEVTTVAETLVYIRRSATKRKDKGKAIMKEDESVQKKTKLQVEQERLGYEEAIRMQEQFDGEERQRLLAEERESYYEVDKARLLIELVNERKRHFAAKRAEERRIKPLTQAQQRNYMSQYIKNMESHTLKHESERAISKIADGSSKRDADEELIQESFKRQKTGESSVPAEEPKDKEPVEPSQKELQQMMIIVLEEGMHVEAMQTKYLIINKEVHSKDTIKYDLVKLWELVKERFSSTEPTDDKERELWVESKRLFEPDTNYLMELQ
ncbi:hypothetical protein Tco_0943728, partial [Tanacetum coccineum]